MCSFCLTFLADESSADEFNDPPFVAGDQRRPERRAYVAFAARLNAAGVLYTDRIFWWQFSRFLERDPSQHACDDLETAELVEQLYDYFMLAGAWIKTQYSIHPYNSWDASITDYDPTSEQWKMWKRNLGVVQVMSNDDNVKAMLQEVLDIMERV